MHDVDPDTPVDARCKAISWVKVTRVCLEKL
jgi:hypothetical protein